ncbi:MAG: hypothetical protein A2445_00565 [Candidatus Jacksonbacteria bacterium RIFOXYC2_FULL_44_29]|nr:MAG: hypothetical protein UW45_C0010G0030 [Parcubacteria group bacterium GW2011_GWC2_44_22]OGY76049.1 MAG: hypothetical protein A2295_03780 [Candidatus Jacksonbacteria bacterium RIFOXYB2_FULL_44_15]OGY76352.1 MAG: hypothetical protein A2240_04295 [Candidatus Jacksonbacteria bacterium RIFOXYA2_FULL_43_12]OGY77990.1 MAG: hypothetical protein A2445_00565 [Candidatus Jacksonbacteria bacterium RIFOXYC2_FULL_44_29]OGY80338.1 MAG: hypothetical protein A2550_04520 [Candidatus Jacksonbacteria bacteri
MKLVTTADLITIPELKEMSEKMFGNMVKAVVDVEKQIMAVDVELHSDAEAFCLEDGSKQQNLWGINLYPDLAAEDWIEFESMINLRPSQGNRSRGVDDAAVREKISQIVNQLIKR